MTRAKNFGRAYMRAPMATASPAYTFGSWVAM